MTSYIMAIDQGTTSTRAILFDKASNIVGVAQKELENYYPHPGWVEQNANDIWASTIGVMFEVLAKTGVRGYPGGCHRHHQSKRDDSCLG